VRLLFVFIVVISLVACGGMPNIGTPLRASTVLPAPQPPGVAGYCAQPPEAAAQPFWDTFCSSNAAPATVALTPDRWSELQSIQTEVDASITYVPSDSWDPLSSAGDCKIYATRTALALLDRGWPAGSLRMATAFVNDGSAQNGASHVVVLVDTDQGTVVLDSRQAGPRPWGSLSYIWLSAEVPGGHGSWSFLTTDIAALRKALLANFAARNREQVAFH
jgi:predicted transglutaminase-like cysteine proteinase